jgi:hypothetical protein
MYQQKGPAVTLRGLSVFSPFSGKQAKNAVKQLKFQRSLGTLWIGTAFTI